MCQAWFKQLISCNSCYKTVKKKSIVKIIFNKEDMAPLKDTNFITCLSLKLMPFSLEKMLWVSDICCGLMELCSVSHYLPSSFSDLLLCVLEASLEVQSLCFMSSWASHLTSDKTMGLHCLNSFLPLSGTDAFCVFWFEVQIIFRQTL